MNILVIDDEQAVVETLERQLLAEGYDVETALNGVEALELFQQKEIHAAIVDLLMPEMDGLELIDKLKQEYPATGIIAISGEGRSGDSEYEINLNAASKRGAHFTFRKPFDFDNLLKALEVLASVN